MQISQHSKHAGHASECKFENYKVFLLVCGLDSTLINVKPLCTLHIIIDLFITAKGKQDNFI